MRRERKRKNKTFLPSFIISNVRSLRNKLKDLGNAMLCVLLICACRIISPNPVSLPGFLTIEADRDFKKAVKLKRVGLAVLVKNRWCHPGFLISEDQIFSCWQLVLLAEHNLQ